MSSNVHTYRVRLYRPQDGIQTLERRAHSAETLNDEFEQAGWTILSIESTQQTAVGQSLRRIFGQFGQFSIPLPVYGKQKRFPAFDTDIFCRELLSLLQAGLSLTECFIGLQAQSSHPVLQQIQYSLESGLALSAAFTHVNEQQSGSPIFPVLLIAALRASERTSQIPNALQRYLDYREHIVALQRIIMNSGLYPFIVLVVGLTVVFFLLMYVVPKFSTMLNELHTNVPTSTRWLIDLGLWVGQSRDFIVCSLLIMAITIGVLWRSQSIAHLINYLLKYHPLINARWLQWQKIRFYRGLGLLLYGGIPLLDSLPLAGQLLQSPQLKTGLQTVIRFISEGKPLSDSLWQMQLIDDLGLRLLHAGEHSGNLVAAFEHLARFYEQQLTRWIEWLGKVLEPTLMLIVGVLIGTIVMLMYVPLFELTTGLN